MAISEPFARILAAGRAQFNQRAMEARRRYTGLDMEGFAAFLHSGVDPLVRAVAEVAPERTPQVTLAAYDIALELLGQSLAGPRARSALLGRVWSEVAPALAVLLARQPVEVLGALTNATVHLESLSGVRAGQWADAMQKLGPRADTVAQLQALGQVLAWRAGAAHFRLGALNAASTLPEPLALAALDANDAGSLESLRARLAANPWSHGPGLNAVHEVGGFTGFGGDFPVPPKVRPWNDSFLVQAGERCFLLIADAHGAVLHAATQDEFDYAEEEAGQLPVALRGGMLLVNQRQVPIDLPPDGLRACCNAHTIAVTSPYTHAIRLLPLQ